MGQSMGYNSFNKGFDFYFQKLDLIQLIIFINNII